MTTYPFYQVDAFTHKPLGGNPCAILLETDGMDEATMLAIAKEMNLSETSFVSASEKADFRVRYFTPAEEIPLAGHPTIATTYALVQAGRIDLTGKLTKISLEMQVGPIDVEIIAQEGKVEKIVMTQMKPQFLGTHDAEKVMPVFDLTPDDVLDGTPIQTVSTGTPQLMIAVRDHDVLRHINMDHAAYAALRKEGDFFSPHLFCLGGATEVGHTFARHFGTPPDTMEDPFTGSATGGMAAYLWHHGLIESPTFVAEQGHWMGRPGQAMVEVVGPQEDIEAVKVGGATAGILKGELYLD
ncbi:MAG: PhzF family phenazine biosynthesis protein [Chloroflexi bacterium]|nr:MAG: PhzF family phenazine biosynthesis protein [Chloroflexota bacterium]MBL1197127.1 PhzF family phenazine biosynthesis protein [Chloroflexota bacterium]NOH14422.1 PhzF family phenazine biosynthesis protein [Chloroflexota bacterium]